MARYIDADALIESIKNELWDWESLDGITSAPVLKQTITDIQNAPTADVVEVVRCKDCLYWKTETEPIGIECEPGEDAHYCYMDGMITRTYDYCSYGDTVNNRQSRRKGENRI